MMKINLFMNNCWKNITVEPSIILICLSSVIEHFLYVNLILQKKCRHNSVEAPDLNTPCDDEEKAQKFISSTNSWRLSSGLILMVLFTVFASSWSDKVGRRRRPLIFIPLIGQIMITIMECLQTYFWQWPVIYAVILEPIFRGLSGGRFSIMYFSQLYICDITSNENRTTKLGIVAAMNIVCIPIGNAVSGFLLKYLGFLYSFLICTILTIIGLIFGIIFIKDISVPVEKKSGFWQILNPTRVYESFNIIFRKRNYRKRPIIILLLTVEILSWFSIYGESSLFYLYLRYKFGWDEAEYSVYIAYKLILLSIGTAFSSCILSKYFKIPDGIIGIVSGSLSIISSILYMFANSKWQLYAVPAIGMFHAALLVVCSSFQSKCLENNEMGHLMSVRCLLSSILSVTFPLYNFIYHKTLNTFPSAFFIISCLANIPCVILFGTAYYMSYGIHVEPISAPCELPTTIQNTFKQSSKEC